LTCERWGFIAGPEQISIRPGVGVAHNAFLEAVMRSDSKAVPRGWERFLSERDKRIFANAGYGQRQGFGRRPVLLVVDVSRNFCGDSSLPILESLDTWRASCGEDAWTALPHIRRLVDVCHERGVPVIYTTMEDLRDDGWDRGRFAEKNRRGGEDRAVHPHDANQIVPELAPGPHDVVIRKYKPSAFHATMLTSFLTDLQADSLVVAGTTTSGCVRATVVDAFSFNYLVAVVEEATFDRGEVSHWMSLFDMHQKYADVVGVDEVVAHLRSVPTDQSARRLPKGAGLPAQAAGSV
jgi:maleamate amidohydrolase